MDWGNQLKSIRGGFDRNALFYGRNPLTTWVGRSELAALESLIPAAPVANTPALDFGCGTGRVIELLLSLGYEVTGYDLSEGMLERARERLGNHPHVRLTSDPKRLAGNYPLIVALGVLDYYQDATPLWQEWRQCLAVGGRLVATAPNGASPLARIYGFFSRFTVQSYPQRLDEHTAVAARQGLSLTDVHWAFPAHPFWAHTVVMKFMNQE
jgi:SAM-dependent methyltransferase